MSNVSAMKVVTLVQDNKANEAAALINQQPTASATWLVAASTTLMSEHQNNQLKVALARQINAA